MTEQEKTEQQDSTQQQTSPKDQTRQLIIFAAILCFAALWGFQNPRPALRVIAVLLGFGGIIMIHEFGHFIVAKLGGIKVEAFSIGMGPIVLGIRKLKEGWRVRVLPKIGEPQQVEEGDNETEYQIALLPIGGFVKMLGQSDTGAADASEDPRSYSNRPISVRIATVAAGVVFNAIGAVIIFMILFTNGIDLKPAVVGHIIHNSPAYDAGLKEGDNIVEVNGKRFIDFESVILAPALSEPGEPISFVVQHADGTEETFEVIADRPDGDESKLRYTGISPGSTLKIPELIRDPNEIEKLYANTGLRPGDEVKALNGQSVQTPFEYAQLESRTFQKEVTLRVLRHWPPDGEQETMVDVSFPVFVGPVVENFRNEHDLAHFSSLVPRLKVAAVSQPGRVQHFVKWFRTAVLRRTPRAFISDLLKEGDVIVKVGDVEFPNYKQLRELTNQHKDKDLPVSVLRKNDSGVEQRVDLMVHPKTGVGSERVMVGFSPELDMDSNVVSQVISVSGHTVIPDVSAGASIVAVDGQPVSNFYEIATLLQNNAGQKVSIDYVHDGRAGGTALVVLEHEPVHAQAQILVGVPFDDLTTEFKYSNPVQATKMGVKKAWQFVLRSYVTLLRLFQGSVPVKALSGPVGIISMTYQFAGTTAAYYFYFLGLISSCLAVMNLLPLPVLDGGHIVFLIIEKITGKPVHEKILVPIMYIGLALLLGLVLVVTYFDIIRIFFSP